MEARPGQAGGGTASLAGMPRLSCSSVPSRACALLLLPQGLRSAVPKRILELMNVEGLTRENVASHLQKYRMFLRRLGGGWGGGLGDPDARLQRLHEVRRCR